MGAIDYTVIVLYVVGLLGAGSVFARRMKNTREMFAAGGQSPWWVSGLSGFMTMFSAGTFVVWGGIAYRYGFVAVAINLCYGVAAILVGWFLAGYWRRLGVDSAAEFLRLRFGDSIVQFYTWLQGTLGIFGMGGAVYALAVVVCALIPLPAGHLLADPDTGNLSVALVTIALCVLVTLITMIGGLWAVLMTDVLQFIILTVSVVFVVPLILSRAGGVGGFLDQAPEGFLSPTAQDFTWWFLAGWVIIHYFKIGGEWAFVQRFTCVPTPGDARKSAYIFGAMYLVSPLFWMLPPIVYRVINPDADFEQAYILACQAVLPAGMVGLMIAAMASATASMATTQLNVYAGAFTTEVYQHFIGKHASDRHLVFVGRVFTVILGLLITTGGLLIPRYGYTRFILDMTALLTGPLVLPTIWGLFSRKIGLAAIWSVTLLGFAGAVVVKFGLAADGFLAGTFLDPLASRVQVNQRVSDLVVGICLPLGVLLVVELAERRVHHGWTAVQARQSLFEERPAVQASTLPAKMVALTVAFIGAIMSVLAILDAAQRGTLAVFALVLFAIGGAISFYAWRGRPTSAPADAG